MTWDHAQAVVGKRSNFARHPFTPLQIMACGSCATNSVSASAAIAAACPALVTLNGARMRLSVAIRSG